MRGLRLTISVCFPGPIHSIQLRGSARRAHPYDVDGQLSRCGSTPDGTRIKVRIGQGQKGPQVVQVAEADASTTQVPSRAERRPSPRLSSYRAGAEPTEECLGSVKMVQRRERVRFRGCGPRRQGRLRSCHDARSERVEWVAGRSAPADANLSGSDGAGEPDQSSSWTDPATLRRLIARRAHSPRISRGVLLLSDVDARFLRPVSSTFARCGSRILWGATPSKWDRHEHLPLTVIHE